MTLLSENLAQSRARAVATPPRLLLGTVLAIILLGTAGRAQAGIVNINFETPPFPSTVQPNNFLAAGAMQTYTQVGVFSISGGVVLGNPSFLPQFASNGSPPNLYGTADFADPSLLSTIILNLDPTQVVTNVTGLLFNGQDTVASGNTESYNVTAFSGMTQVAIQSFALSTDLTSSGSLTSFSVSSSVAAPITTVTFTTPNAGVNGWDFLVDSIKVTTGPAVPEPTTVALVSTGLLFGLVYAGIRRRPKVEVECRH